MTPHQRVSQPMKQFCMGDDVGCDPLAKPSDDLGLPGGRNGPAARKRR
jgi:hypothetical protein